MSRKIIHLWKLPSSAPEIWETESTDAPFDSGSTPTTSGITQSFGRDLELRTHPDEDIAAKTVELIYAPEIVMDDGSSETNWSLKTADITASGAGGLDTGAEASSTWYDIYAIAKADHTQAIMLHKSTVWAIDQSQTTANDNNKLRDVTGDTKLAQGVKVSTTGTYPFVDLLIFRNSSPTGRVWVTIETDSSGSPSGTPVTGGTSDKLKIDNLTTSGNGTRVRFVFRTPPTLTSATQYHIVLQGDFTINVTNHITWRGVTVSGYADGSAKKFDGSTWSAATPADFVFRLYSETSASVTMPTGYTKKALIGHVFNDSSSDFIRFAQQDRFVQLHTPRAAFSTNTFQLVHGVDYSGFMPPLKRISPLIHAFNTNTGVDHRTSTVPHGFDDTTGYEVTNTNASVPVVYQPFVSGYQFMYHRTSAAGASWYINGWTW